MDYNNIFNSNNLYRILKIIKFKFLSKEMNLIMKL